MQRFAILFVLLLFLPDAYIYFVHLIKITQSTVLRTLWWMPTLVMVLIYLGLYLTSDNLLSDHTEAIGNLSTAMIILGVTKFLFIPFSLLGLLMSFISRQHIPSGPFFYAGLMVSTLVFVLIIIGRFYGIHHFQVKEVPVRITGLPSSFNGYRIIQLSDIHSGSFAQRKDDLRKMVEMVNAQKADLIVFTGDLVNAHHNEAQAVMDVLSGLRARDGVYSVLGNHDYGTYYNWDNKRQEVENLQRLKEIEAQMGWKMLNNENVILHKGEGSLALIGVENAGKAPFPDFSDLDKAMKGTEGLTKILLSHDPTHWEREVLPKTDIQLMLSGHTHATQVQFGSISPSAFVYDQWGGLYEKEDQKLYVNVGMGYVGIPFRIGAWPEITVLTLQE